MTALLNYFDDLEGDLCVRINRYGRRAWIRRVFAAVSKAGDGGFWALPGLACLLADSEAALPFLARTALVAAVGVGLYKLLKNRLVRERPYISHPGIDCGTAPLDRYSFPSGHTLHAVSFTILFTHYDPWFAVVCLPFAVLVAMSRVVLGLHYPSDVVAGAAIGATLAAAAIASV